MTILLGVWTKQLLPWSLEVQEKKNKSNSKCRLAEQNLPFIVFSIQIGQQRKCRFLQPP